MIKPNVVNKHNNYAKLKIKLKIAMTHEFWIEALMLEYSIIEDRLASILKNCNICKNPYEKKIASKLSSIEFQIGKKHPIISKKISLELIQDIGDWKEKRNDIVHNICNINIDDDNLKNIANIGFDIMKHTDNAASRISRIANKQ